MVIFFFNKLERNIFFIPADKKVEAFEHAHKKLLDERKTKARGGGSDGKKWYAFTDNEEVDNAKTLEELIIAFNWRAETDDEGNIETIQCECEKSGQDILLFEALAPFVKKDSYIEMDGEDGAVWRWIFDGNICKDVNAKFVFEE